MTDQPTFAELIRRRRLELRIPQARLAAAAGVSQTFISLLEGGLWLSPLRPETVTGLAAALKITPTWLLLLAGHVPQATSEAITERQDPGFCRLVERLAGLDVKRLEALNQAIDQIGDSDE